MRPVRRGHIRLLRDAHRLGDGHRQGFPGRRGCRWRHPRPGGRAAALFDTRPASEAPEYRSYREILTDAAVRVGGRLGWPIDRTRAAFLPDSLPRWMPFADTNPALVRLSQAGYALGILSNVDDDLPADTLQHLAVTFSFSLLITAQQVRSYKPAPGHFVRARSRIAPQPWLHAAQSYFHDVTPAVAHNIPVAWINRKRERVIGAAWPDWEFRTLTELADWLA